MTLATGTKLGRYEVRSKIGEGGMGEVYLALDTELDRTVAIKILPAELASDQQRMQRFIQEAKAASALNHPHILTIYEIGTSDEMRFIVTEFIDGETMRQHVKTGRLKLNEILETAIQTAGALAAAHAAGIIHRDVKPENIMVRRDGYIKLLDFGLAKLTEPAGSITDTEAPTKALVNTGAGTVMGTANYMSPEQAKGKGVDVRTDLWSLGAVIYELVTSRPPFEAETPSEVIAQILDKEPPPLARYDREAPPELERILTKALTKNREERYQTAKDLLNDFKRLKRRLDVEAEIERTVPPEFRSSGTVATHSGTHEPGTAAHPAAARTASGEAVHPGSSAEYIVSEIKRHKRGFALAAAVVFALVLATAGYFIYARRAPALTDKDTILLADFVNTTGDPVFDGTLNQALAVQLAQSPFLNIFSDERVREALRFMGRSPDDRVTKEIAREICQRQGMKALLAGSISGLGSNYVITLEALNAGSGDVIAREQAEANSKEQVLKVLGQASSKLREKLGESLSSIQKFDAPIEQATTSSLEALKAFALGNEMRDKGREVDAIPFYKRATELDGNFALAYARLAVMYGNSAQPGLAGEAAQKAFELRDRVSEREKLYISEKYGTFVTGELDKQIEVLELWTRTYPRDSVPFNNLALLHRWIGQPEKAVEEARESARLRPTAFTPYSNWASAFVQLNRYEEAKQVLAQALKQTPDATPYHLILYRIAFVQGDEATMQQQAQWFTGKPTEAELVNFQSLAAASTGQLRKSLELSRRTVELWTIRGRKENAAFRITSDAVTRAAFGNCQEVRADTARGLALARTKLILISAGVASATCNDMSQTQSLVEEMAKRYPNDTEINGIWLPTIRAITENNRGNSSQAVQLLQPTSRYELGFLALYWPIYIRGQAYLQQRAGTEAAAEFQRILDHRGVAIASPLYPLAHLGLARAATLRGDIAASRKAYQDFLALWKDGDTDIPILIEAKQEYAKLK